MKFLTKQLILKIVDVVYSEGIYPLLHDFVSQTSNKYDDKALELVDEFISEFIKNLS